MRNLFWVRFTLSQIAHFEQENNIGDDFIEDLKDFQKSDFRIDIW